MEHNATAEEMTNMIFRVPVSLRERFRELAKSQHRTMSQELRRLMEQRICELEEGT